MTTERERLATVEAVLREVQADVIEIRQESTRTRLRLHSLEGIASAFLSWQTDAREKEERQYQRLGLRVQVLTVVVAVAAIVTPFLYNLTGGH